MSTQPDPSTPAEDRGPDAGPEAGSDAGPEAGRQSRSAAREATRQAILHAATERFAEVGYDRATVRQIASAAGTDPALVIRHFGSKDALFAEMLSSGSRLPARLIATLDGHAPGFAERLLRAYLGAWEDPESSLVLQAAVRSAVSSPIAAAAVRAMVQGDILPAAVAAGYAPERMTLAGPQMLGVAIARYIVRAEPVASLSIDELVALMLPGFEALIGDASELEQRP